LPDISYPRAKRQTPRAPFCRRGVRAQAEPETSRFPHKELLHIPSIGAENDEIFAAQWLAYALPRRRFAVALVDADARLGANADRYSFIAGDFHRLLFAGFDRRTESFTLSPESSNLMYGMYKKL
jgi:hypothetical protein